jgi:hypothetical protein
MSEPEVEVVCLTDHFLVLSLRERLERGSPLALEEWRFLERLLDRLELDALQVSGFPPEWK